MTSIFVNGALGLAINSERKLFLTQRNEPDDPNFHQKWNIPGGGIEWGEKPEETLVREFFEELHVVPSIIFPHPITLTSIQGDAHVLLLCYVVDIKDQIVDTEQDKDHETLAYGWFSEAEAEKLDLLPDTIEVIRQALALFDHRDILSSIK